MWRQLCVTAILALCPAAAQAAPVLMISIDGLRPGDVLEAAQRGIKLPTLTKLTTEGVYATGVRNVLPTVTYPDHTTLITGVWPARHGIAGNQTFDPLRQNMAGWYWYTQDIKVKTLWDAVHETGGKVASLSWPVSVGASSIDFNLPEYWRADIPEDLKLVRALATPGLIDSLEKSSGVKFADADGETVTGDEGRDRFAAALIAAKHPELTTVHLRSFDSTEHAYGPGSPEAKAVLEKLDASIGVLIAAARRAEPDLVVAIVSDHGFAPLAHDVNIIKPFIDAGLITVNSKTGKIVSWKAEPWGGASAAVVLAHPEDAGVKAQVAALLAKLAADPAYGIGHVADAGEIAKLGGTPMASFWIDFKLGTAMGSDPQAPQIGPGSELGIHGYFPHPSGNARHLHPGRPRRAAERLAGRYRHARHRPDLGKNPEGQLAGCRRPPVVVMRSCRVPPPRASTSPMKET